MFSNKLFLIIIRIWRYSRVTWSSTWWPTSSVIARPRTTKPPLQPQIPPSVRHHTRPPPAYTSPRRRWAYPRRPLPLVDHRAPHHSPHRPAPSQRCRRRQLAAFPLHLTAVSAVVWVWCVRKRMLAVCRWLTGRLRRGLSCAVKWALTGEYFVTYFKDCSVYMHRIFSIMTKWTQFENILNLLQKKVLAKLLSNEPFGSCCDIS